MGKRVVVAGCFDIIHVGHLRLLKEAKKLGGENAELIVVIARDDSVSRIKGREPIFPAEDRKELIEGLKPVNKAVIGYPGPDFLKIIIDLKPDILVLGYDQPFNEEEVRERLRKAGLKTKVVRMPKFTASPGSTTEVIQRILDRVKP